MDMMNCVLNVLLLLVPVTGILHLFGLGKSIDLGVFQLSYGVSMSQQNLKLLGLTHNVLGKLLRAIALLHSSTHCGTTSENGMTLFVACCRGHQNDFGRDA